MEERHVPEAVILDTGVLYALVDRKDAWHRRSVAFVDGYEGRLLAPSTVIPEACHLMQAHLGRRVELAFVKALAAGELTIVHFTADDLARCVALLKTYGDAEIGFVDSSVVAIAERLRIATILTTDRRHFSIIRSKDGSPFTLLP